MSLAFNNKDDLQKWWQHIKITMLSKNEEDLKKWRQHEKKI